MRTLSGDECFTFEDIPNGKQLNDFWSWGFSDLYNNTLRGILAEFIVASAIGIDTKQTREEWAAYDLLTASGRKIEVKSSAYIQSWCNQRMSKIQFSIRPTHSWNVKKGYSNEIQRQSDLYVFCLYANRDKSKSPLQLDQWEFYIISTSTLNEKCGDQKSITLNSLLSLFPIKATYNGLHDAIENLSI